MDENLPDAGTQGNLTLIPVRLQNSSVKSLQFRFSIQDKILHFNDH